MSAPMTRAQMAIALSTARWNALVPKCAVIFRWGATHLSYLHPTKGWRRVSYERLGFRQA